MELKEKTGIGIKDLINHIGIRRNKFYEWVGRLGIGNRHNGKIPKSHWLTEEEKANIIGVGKSKLRGRIQEVML